MQVKIHTGFQHHPLREEFIQFDVEIDIGFGPFDEGAAHLFQPLDKLPRNAADNQFAVKGIFFLVHEGENAQRGYVAHSGHTAQKTIPLDEGYPFARGLGVGGAGLAGAFTVESGADLAVELARSGDGSDEAGRTSASHDHIIAPGGLDSLLQLLFRFL